ncbi:MAG: hypothetical protein ACI8PP_000467 [Candidatus Pseudothioglobus sp.]|jgi:hypothetical protein
MATSVVHLMPLLTDNGITMEAATRVFLVLLLGRTAGRILGGQRVDVVGPLPTYMMMALGQTVFMF